MSLSTPLCYPVKLVNIITDYVFKKKPLCDRWDRPLYQGAGWVDFLTA